MTPKYLLQAQAQVIKPIEQYTIDWQRIAEQVAEAADLIKNKEPEMKKKNGKRKKGY